MNMDMVQPLTTGVALEIMKEIFPDKIPEIKRVFTKLLRPKSETESQIKYRVKYRYYDYSLELFNKYLKSKITDDYPYDENKQVIDKINKILSDIDYIGIQSFKIGLCDDHEDKNLYLQFPRDPIDSSPEFMLIHKKNI